MTAAGEPTRSLVVRVWLPDRPGALGAVASRIGGVGGDVHEIEVVDRGGGRAVDEFLVTVPVTVSDELLAREIVAVDGSDVEDLRTVDYVERDPRIDALEAAAALAEARDAAALDAALAEQACRELRAVWAAVIGDGSVQALVGEGPEERWIIAFGTGAAAGGPGDLAGQAGVAHDEDGEVAWAVVPDRRRVLLTGRTGIPFRPRERRVLELLARLAAAAGT